MINGLEALEELKFQVGNITYYTRDLQITTVQVRGSGLFEIIENELKNYYALKKECEEAKWYQEHKALEIVKKFVWVEDGEIHLGLYADSEIILSKDDFETQEEYDLLNEVLL